ncbi:ABC transporter substrate-binding protein [Moritella sp. Urea-trap-13]|uniref:ABC transporter substrate-binding protein n=1 Tax=Moritella sp. Urea-trap-13 TaxID=2058327 RepID=UPI000C341435|nr:ABC transporter substrate-binding protein [Moritella sp. Urea-trap-13]PKH05954.1 sugar ABC transporter substrate-binding protein [Moritella sp. Urea-trap-13]
MSLIASQVMNVFKCQLVFLLLIFVPTVNATSHTVVFISPGHADQGFWQAVTDTMSAAAEQLDFELEVHYADREWAKMVRITELVVARTDKPDFLILVNEYQQGARLLALADKAGVPTLMLLNSLTPEQHNIYGAPRGQLKNWLGSLTPNNEIAGYEIAQSLVRHVNQENNPPPIALLTLAGDNKTPASQARLRGLDRALNDFPVLKEQRRVSVNWSGDEAYKRTRLWLQSGQPLGAVWAANDAVALGAIKAIREAGLKPGIDVKVAGLNWSQDAIEHVIDGEMTLTHGGHIFAGAWAIVMLYDYVQGHDFNSISAEVDFPMTAINQANAPDYLKHFGRQQWSHIDFKNFSLTHSKKLTGYQFTLPKLFQSLREPIQK